MPIRAFWLLNNNIDRIQASFDLRKAMINVRTGINANEESVGSLQQMLTAETGEVVTISDESKLELSSIRDHNAIDQLKSLQ